MAVRRDTLRALGGARASEQEGERVEGAWEEDERAVAVVHLLARLELEVERIERLIGQQSPLGIERRQAVVVEVGSLASVVRSSWRRDARAAADLPRSGGTLA